MKGIVSRDPGWAAGDVIDEAYIGDDPLIVFKIVILLLRFIF
jgi:hypothetical protein